jgi:2'-5' RNA ligase
VYLRVFIAAHIPEEIKEEINEYLTEMKPHWEGVKWESQDKLHVTLKFLGEIEESIVGKIQDILEELLLIYSPFEMTISTFGGFPNLKNPRVLFIGLSENHGLIRLQSEIEERLEALGFKKERRIFTPHITVGRIKGRARSKGALHFPNNTPFLITQIAVMRSELSPHGSKYTPLSVFRLAR